MKDPLAITRGLTVTDRALISAGFDEDERLAVWSATVDALVVQSSVEQEDIELALMVMPGNYLLLEDREGRLERAEIGTPFVTTGPESLRVPLRRFGSEFWDIDGGSWAPGWWNRVKEQIYSPSDWDEDDDMDRVLARVAKTFDEIWRQGHWPRMGWWRARPGWVDLIFPECHDAMKRGLRRALAQVQGTDPIVHVPVLAGGKKLERITHKNLGQGRTELFAPSDAGYRAFVENVQSQGVPRSIAMSMAFSWWERIYEGHKA